MPCTDNTPEAVCKRYQIKKSYGTHASCDKITPEQQCKEQKKWIYDMNGAKQSMHENIVLELLKEAMR